jgi:hypothetical protein
MNEYCINYNADMKLIFMLQRFTKHLVKLMISLRSGIPPSGPHRSVAFRHGRERRRPQWWFIRTVPEK